MLTERSEMLNRHIKVVCALIALALGVWPLWSLLPAGDLKAPIVGVYVAATVWLLTYLNTELKEFEKTKTLKKVFWSELHSLALTVVTEVKWWDERHKLIEVERNKTIGSRKAPLLWTPPRIVSHFDLVAIKANLSRIAEIEVRSADSIVKVLALLRALEKIVPAYYTAEDELANDEEIRIADRYLQQSNNVQNLALHLKHICVEAIVAAELIDHHKEFKKFQIASITVEERDQQKDEFALINLWRAQLGTR